MADHEFGRWTVSEEDLVDLDAVKARDLVVECFYQAQHATFAQQGIDLGLGDNDDFVRRSVVGAVRMAIREVGGDFDAPTCDALTRSLDVLAEKAASWGTPQELIEYHKNEVLDVLARLDAA